MHHKNSTGLQRTAVTQSLQADMKSGENLLTGEFLLIGELKSAYGIKGWLWVYSYTDPIENIFDYTPWFYSQNGKSDTSLDELKVLSWRKQGRGLVAKLAGIDNRTLAERYRGTKLWIPQSKLPKPKPGEYYTSELIGFKALLNAGQVLGEVEEFMDNAAHPIVKVKPTNDSVDSETRLIPWHESTISKVDKEQAHIIFNWQLDY